MLPRFAHDEQPLVCRSEPGELHVALLGIVCAWRQHIRGAPSMGECEDDACLARCAGTCGRNQRPLGTGHGERRDQKPQVPTPQGRAHGAGGMCTGRTHSDKRFDQRALRDSPGGAAAHRPFSRECRAVGAHRLVDGREELALEAPK